MKHRGLPAAPRMEHNGLPAVAGQTNPAMAYLISLQSQQSRTVMRRRLDALARRYFTGDWMTCPWHELEKEHLDGVVMAELERGCSVSYVNQSLAALRGVVNACFDLKLIDAERYMRLKRAKPARGGRTEPAGRYVRLDEREAMIRVCDKSAMGRRDAAMLLCLMGLGLRRTEVTSLNREDLTEACDEEGEMGYQIEVRGKGRKIRPVFAANSVYLALRDWLRARGDQGGALFYAGHKSGTLYPQRGLSDRGLYFMFGRRAADAGVLDVVPHDMRRSFASDHLAAGTDIVTLSHILGHSSTDVTGRYDRRGEEAMRAAATTLHFAYTPAENGPPMVGGGENATSD